MISLPSKHSPDPSSRPSMLPHPPQPASLPHLAYPPQHAPFLPRATPRSLSTVDRLPLHHQPAQRAQDHQPDDSPLEHPSAYSYVPRGHPAHSSPSPDTMYQHSVHSPLFDLSQNALSNHNPQQQPNPEYDVQSRQQPPAIHTGNLLYPSDPGNFTPSPASSPADNAVAPQSSLSRQFSFPQPMSAPHTQNAFPQRFANEPGLSRLPFTNPTLDRRMSEPVLGAGRQTFPQPPPSHHDTFAYSATGSTTMVQPSPVSPRPSSSYSSYGTYPEHQRDSSGASIGSAGLSDPYANPIAAWGSGVKQAELDAEAQMTSSPLSPLYAASAASGSDASVTGLPSPPVHPLQSPSRNTAVPSGSGLRPQQGAAGQASAGSTRPGGNNNKTYSFISFAQNVKKRPRRRYDEIERLYQCRCASIPRSIWLPRTENIHSICLPITPVTRSCVWCELHRSTASGRFLLFVVCA